MNSDCIFCKIVQHKAPADIVYEDKDTMAIKSINPVAETHILIIPKGHVETFMDIKKQDKYLNQMAHTAQILIKQLSLLKGYKLNFNGGKYQEIPHLHWHLLGGKFISNHDI